MDTPSEVCDFDFAINTEQDILRLDIAMDDMFRVTVVQGMCNTSSVAGGASFIKGVHSQMFVQLALGGVLEDEKDSVVVVEEAEETKDVGVSQMRLDFDFASQLVFNLTFEQLFLEEHLEGDYVLGALLAGEIDAAVLALAEGASDLEVGEYPGAGRVCVRGAAAHGIAMGGAGTEGRWGLCSDGFRRDICGGGEVKIGKKVLFPGSGGGVGECERHCKGGDWEVVGGTGRGRREGDAMAET